MTIDSIRAIILLLCVAGVLAQSQVRTDGRDRLYPTLLDKGSRVADAQTEKIQALFKSVETGILGGDIAKFSRHFDKQIFVNISSGESGYFSSEQAASLLQHYLTTRKVVSFKFSRINDKGLTPYATGRLVSIYRGIQESAQVYVSCSLEAKEWVIGQFNIY
jgi:hypothetical protein